MGPSHINEGCQLALRYTSAKDVNSWRRHGCIDRVLSTVSLEVLGLQDPVDGISNGVEYVRVRHCHCHILNESLMLQGIGCDVLVTRGDPLPKDSGIVEKISHGSRACSILRSTRISGRYIFGPDIEERPEVVEALSGV